MGPEIPHDSSGTPVSVGVGVKRSAVSESERCAWCQLVQRPRPLVHPLLLSRVSLHRAGLGHHAWSPLLLLPYPTYCMPGGLQSLIPAQQWSVSSVPFLPFAPTPEVCRGLEPAHLQWEPAHLQGPWHSSVKLQVTPGAPVGRKISHRCFLCHCSSLGRAGAALAVLCFSPLCLWEMPVTAVASPAVPAFSIKPFSRSQWAH